MTDKTPKIPTAPVTLSDLLKGARSPIMFNAGVLGEAVAKVAEQRKDKAAAAAVGVLNGALSRLEESVSTLRSIRKQEKKQAELVETLDRTVKYFAETGNPFPYFAAANLKHYAVTWCNQAGLELPDPDDAAWNIPADWKPSNPS